LIQQWLPLIGKFQAISWLMDHFNPEFFERICERHIIKHQDRLALKFAKKKECTIGIE
jgi:hypothetical protein